jgi:hypothetical protein
MTRGFFIAAALLVAGLASAQAQQPQAYPPPQQPQPAQPPAQQPPAQQPPPPAPPPPSSAPPSTAGSQGTSSTAQPGSPGASSQQVVVNPPSAQQPSTATAPPSSTTVINPPGATYRDDTLVVEERYKPNPFATVATDAAWGGLAGLLVGFGVTLVNEFDHWDRDLMVGAGVGVLAGAAVGVAHAAYDARQADRRRRVAYGDGMNRTDRDPVITGPTFGLAGRF